ncbi:hypothetical protein ZWY2020_021955 [Hordeum vulgare]|nr:hypothetical protein ZWY2020_021955 [Hordeum vulgare]
MREALPAAHFASSREDPPRDLSWLPSDRARHRRLWRSTTTIHGVMPPKATGSAKPLAGAGQDPALHGPA